MSYDFPNSPANGQEFTPPGGGPTYVWQNPIWMQKVTASSGSTDWANVTNKPSTFPPTLPIAQSGVTNLVIDLAAKAPLASPAFTGIPTAPTPATSVNDTSIATTAFVQANTALKENVIASGTVAQYWRGDKAWAMLDKAAVGLANVDNTSDANKPVSVATQTALNLKEDKASKGIANGYASLDSTAKVPASQLPSYVDDVLEFANFGSFPVTGSTGVIYVALDTGKIYRWSGSAYVEISPSPGSTDAVPEGSTNLYFTNGRASAAAPVQSVAGRTGSVVLTKADVGLSNVDNTSDVNKPISTATQAALDTKALLASPLFTGDPRAPTPATSDNDTSIATSAFVKAQGYLNDAPSDGKQYARQNATWSQVVGGGSGSGNAVVISESPPSSPNVGDMWWKSNDGNLYIWYNDGNSLQWVPSTVNHPGDRGPQGATGEQGPQGTQGPPGANGSPDTAAQVLAKLVTVDGSGSNLDADVLDGQTGTWYQDRANHTGAQAISTVSNLQVALDSKIPDAPSDGKYYVRRDGAWIEMPAPAPTPMTYDLNGDAVIKFSGTIMIRIKPTGLILTKDDIEIFSVSV